MPAFLFTPCGLGWGRTSPGVSTQRTRPFEQILLTWKRTSRFHYPKQKCVKLFGDLCAAHYGSVIQLHLELNRVLGGGARPSNLSKLCSLNLFGLGSQKLVCGGIGFGTAVCLNSISNYLTHKTTPINKYWVVGLSGIKTFSLEGKDRFCVTKAPPVRAAWTTRKVAIGVAVKDALCSDAQWPRCRPSGSSPPGRGMCRLLHW